MCYTILDMCACTCIRTYSVMSISLNLFLYTYHSLRLLSVTVIPCSLGPHLRVIPLPTAAAVEGSAVGWGEGGGEGCPLWAGQALSVHEEPSLQGLFFVQHGCQWHWQRWETGRSQQVGDAYVCTHVRMDIGTYCTCVRMYMDTNACTVHTYVHTWIHYY